MESTTLINLANDHLIYTYNRYEIVLEKGDGIYLYDKEGKSYLDFGSGIAVFAFGYNNPEFNESIKEQIDKLIHTSNYFYNENAALASKKLTEISKMERVFFTNSGTEAIEGAVKLAKKFGFLRDGHHNHEIIAMHHSFHGRSMGALAVTGNFSYQENFGGMIPGIRFANHNDIESVKSLINKNTAAIILETVQGEGGIHPSDKAFLQEIRKICDEKNLLLILDEIQCGMGRTGKMFAYEHYDILPDVVTTAKALGQGFPVGAFLTRGKANAVLVPGDHGSTYGGNPLAGKAILTTLKMFEKNNFEILNHVEEVSKYLEEELLKLSKEYDFIKSVRGLGLMQGLVIDEKIKAGDVIKKCIENGLILFAASENVIRFVPPLIIKKEDVDKMIEILKTAFKSFVG